MSAAPEKTPVVAAQAAPPAGPLLEVVNLQVCFRRGRARVLPVVDVANLNLNANKAVGIVGESGSGKSMLCRALIGTLPRHGAEVTSGQIRFGGRELAAAPERVWRGVRGRQIGYVPQSSLAGLNPVLTVETQLVQCLTAAKRSAGLDVRREALRLLDMVHIPRAEQVLKERAHQLSGGMRQRIMIAAAIAQNPQLLIADEPTTALDVTIQREILTLISTLRRELGMALILVSHDLAVIEEVCDSVMVMYAGFSVETGPVEQLASRPRHPYTRALRVSRVDVAQAGEDLEAIPGDVVSLGAWPDGCRFSPRCPLAGDDCRQNPHPALAPVDQQLSACIHWAQVDPP